ncbi:MAG: choice-of-anchor J domain-containing protein [Bacteroidales bacterium]|nr:choice-of-anchor J domain-containing protein [Bacteroidales bacterium]
MKKMLRNFLWGGVVLSSLLVAGCAKEYDDTELRGKISDLDSRLTQLEQAVKTLNEQTVPAIQTLVNALDAKLTVTAVVTNNDGSYTILFSDNTSVTIANGEKGDKGDQGNPGDKGDPGDPGAPGAPGATPEIGVKLIDGVYYWTINGKLIPDDDNPLPVTGQNGQDGATPTFRLNEDVLEYSVDGGKTWTPVPVVGESKPSITVEETDEAVIFTLSDGTVFQLAKELPFCIKFSNADDITIMAGETAYVGYTLQGVGEKDVTEVGILTATPGFDAEVEPYAGQNDAGIISITNNDEDDSKEHSVYVFAANGKGKTDIKGLHFASTRLQAVLSVQVVPAAGGDSFQLNVKANEDYTVEVSPAAQSWITVEQPTRAALYNDNLTVTVAANETNAYRSGTVSLISKESQEVLDQIDVLQAPASTEATDLASVAVLPDGTGVTVYNVTAIAASDSKAIVTDGQAFMYVNAKGLYEGVFDLNGTKNTDEAGFAYIDVKSLNMKMDQDPAEVDPHAAFYYYASGANGYTYFFTVINGKVGKSKGLFYVEDSTGAVQLLLPDAPEDLGLEALVGKYAAVKAWVINGEEDKDENLFLNAIATDVKALSFADPGWAISYDQENNDAVSVAAGASDSFLFSCLSEQDILANYKSIDNFLAAAPFDNVDNFYYTTWYYNVLFGYDFDYIYSALVKTGPYEDNIKNLGFGKHYIIAVGVDEDGALTGAFACKEIEKISPYGFRTYGDYLGEYTFTNSNGVNEVWTFSENVAGESYLVSGIAGIAAANLGGGQVASAEFDPASGLVSFSNQALGEWDNNGTPLTDKFVAVWYSGSNFSSNESYMGDPLILSFGMDQEENIDIIVESDSYGPLEGFGYIATTATGSMAGKYGAVKFDNAKLVKGVVAPEPEIEYEDYLGEWALGTSVWTIAQKTAGESYSITGIAGQDGFPAVEALFENGQIKVSEADFGADGEGYELYLSGIITSGGKGYISYPFNSDAPDLLFTGKLDSEGNIKLNPGSNTKYNIAFTSFLFLAYLDNDNAFQSKTTSLPAVLSPYVFVPDENVYVYKEEFENSVDSWTFIDADGDGYNWALSTALDAHSGDGLIFSQSYVNQVGALTPDNWAFTPAITLTSDNYLSFWALGQDPNYCAEHYAAYILTEAPTVDNLSSAEVLVPESVATKDYVQKIAQIPSKYNGQTVYIGIRHFNCTDMYYLDIDDVAVIEGEPKPTSAPAFGPSKANASAILTAKKAKTIKYINRPAVASRARGGVNVTPNASMKFVQGAGYAVRPAAPATAESSQIVLQKKQK